MVNFIKLINAGSMMGITLVDEIIEDIVAFLGGILWCLCDIFFIVLDLFEDLFRRLAGVESGVTGADGTEIGGDLVLYLINSDLVQNIFFSILALSLVLLVIFTIFAVARNVYADKPEPISKFVNSSFKALLMYLMVPVATVVCLMVGNVVLQAIDGATRTQINGGTASDMLFMSAAYNANELRDTDTSACILELKNWYENGYLPESISLQLAPLGLDKDNVNSVTKSTPGIRDKLDSAANIIDEAFVNGELYGDAGKWGYVSVARYYNILEVNLIMVWAGGGFLIWALGKMSWGLLSRMFKMTLYFAISPAVMAVFPLKGDSALKSWTGEMVKLGTLAYSAVGVLNVLYSIMPFFDKINLYAGVGFVNALANSLIKLFLLIVAFTSANSLIDTIGGWFGLGNIIKEGEGARKSITGELKKYSEKGIGTISGAYAGMKMAQGQGKNSFAGFVAGAFGGAGGKLPGSGIRDMAKKGKEAGESLYKEGSTRKLIFGPEDENKVKAWEDNEKLAKAKKDVDKQIAGLDEWKKAEIEKIDQGKESEAEKTARKKILDSRYEQMVTQVKSNSEILSGKFAGEEKALELSKQGVSDRKEKSLTLKEFSQAQSERTAQIKRLAQQTGADESYISKIWQGLVDGTSNVGGAIKTAFTSSEFYKDVQANERALKSAKEAIVEMHTSTEGESYLKEVFGDSIDKDGHIIKVTEALDKVKEESKRIRKMERDLVDATEQLKKDKAKKYDEEIDKLSGKDKGKK